MKTICPVFAFSMDVPSFYVFMLLHFAVPPLLLGLIIFWSIKQILKRNNNYKIFAWLALGVSVLMLWYFLDVLIL